MHGHSSVFGYNYLLTRTKVLVTELENFAKRSGGYDKVEEPLAIHHAAFLSQKAFPGGKFEPMSPL